MLLVLSILTNGFGGVSNSGSYNAPSLKGSSFDTVKDDQICTDNGKPIIRLFSTTTCPHCRWSGATFDKVVKEYVDNGKITAYHWELDSRDNTLTEAIEKQVPNAEGMLFEQFNPGGGVPTYVFGCKYVRIGNAYEREGDAGLLKEEMEFRKIIDELIASSTT